MTPRSLKTLLAAAVLALAMPAAAQERPEGCVIEQWPAYLGPGEQTFETREMLETDAGEIHAVVFGPPKGEYAKLFLFFLVHDGCERKVFSVGTYGYMNDFARARGEIGEGQRVYHLDLYEPKRHSTLEIRYQKPSYQEMRERALNVLR